MKTRRATATLTLVLIGAAALQACGDDETETRDVYRTRADCQRDWGDDTAKCQTVSSGPHAGYFYGPSYGYGRSGASTGSTLAPRSGSHAVGSTSVSRGGFGSSASAHSSGG